MSNYRKVHLSLTPETFRAIRKFAFDAEISISQAIDLLIEKSLIEKRLRFKFVEPSVETESEQTPEGPSQSGTTTWSGLP